MNSSQLDCLYDEQRKRRLGQKVLLMTMEINMSTLLICLEYPESHFWWCFVSKLDRMIVETLSDLLKRKYKSIRLLA